MILDPDCIRDVMIALEEITGVYVSDVGSYNFYGVSCQSLMKRPSIGEKYKDGEVAYALIQLSESGYIRMSFSCEEKHGTLNLGKILYVTPKGHDFVSRIKDGEQWTKKIVPIVKKAGSVSLYVIEAVSKGFADAFFDRLTLDDKP